MCGIFGVVAATGTLNLDQQAFIRAATIVGQLRGEDGTGWIVQTPEAAVSTYKRALCGNDFLASRQGRKANNRLAGARAVIGHNRKTTSGGDVDRDCHPYDYDNLCGVHNGGIPPHVLSRLDTDDTIANVDSAKLYAALNSVKNPLTVLNKVHAGGFALAWIDKRTDELCMTRNHDRPLWASSGEKGVYFASEPGMLFWLMSRHGLNSETSKLYELAPHVLYRVPMDNPGALRRAEYKPAGPVIQTYKERQEAAKAKAKACVKSLPVANVPPRDKSWYATRTPISAYTSCISLFEMTSKFPLLGIFADIIKDNMDDVAVENVDGEELGEPSADRLDIIITEVEPREHNVMYPNVRGYMVDTTDSGILIPITMSAVKDDGFGFVDHYEAAKKKGELCMGRVRFKSIRICADGTVTIFAAPINLWTEESNVKVTPEIATNILEVQDNITGRDVSVTDAEQLNQMWLRLAPPEDAKPDPTHH
jgi:predicted glutamine amidotransferase